MDPKKSSTDRHTENRREQFKEDPAPEKKGKDDSTSNVDEVIDKESYANRNHGRTHDGNADVTNPGTV